MELQWPDKRHLTRHDCGLMNDNNIHVLGISETHLRQGSNDKFTWYSKERLGNEKKGGGTLTIIKPGLTIHCMNLHYQCIHTWIMSESGY